MPRGGGKAASSIPYVTERDFEAQVLRSELPVLMQFTADWCQPCKAIAPDVEAFAREMRGQGQGREESMSTRPPSSPSSSAFRACRRSWWWPKGASGHRGRRHPQEEDARDCRAVPAARGRGAQAGRACQLISAKAVAAVDTRDSAAFARAHLPGAINIPLEELEGRLAELHMLQGQPVLYCRGGDKTKEVSERLAEQGLPVAFLEGGLLAWEAEGLPIRALSRGAPSGDRPCSWPAPGASRREKWRPG